MNGYGEVHSRFGYKDFENKLAALKYKQIAHLPAPFPSYSTRLSQLPMNDGDVFYIPGTHTGYVSNGRLDHFLIQLHPKAPLPVAVSQLGLAGNIYTSKEAGDTTLRGNMPNLKRQQTFVEFMQLKPGGVFAYERREAPPPFKTKALDYYSLKGFKPQQLVGAWVEDLQGDPAHLSIQSVGSGRLAGGYPMTGIYKTRTLAGDTAILPLAGARFDGFKLNATLRDSTGTKAGVIQLSLFLDDKGLALNGVTVPGVTGNPKTFRGG